MALNVLTYVFFFAYGVQRDVEYSNFFILDSFCEKAEYLRGFQIIFEISNIQFEFEILQNQE